MGSAVIFNPTPYRRRFRVRVRDEWFSGILGGYEKIDKEAGLTTYRSFVWHSSILHALPGLRIELDDQSVLTGLRETEANAWVRQYQNHGRTKRGFWFHLIAEAYHRMPVVQFWLRLGIDKLRIEPALSDHLHIEGAGVAWRNHTLVEPPARPDGSLPTVGPGQSILAWGVLLFPGQKDLGCPLDGAYDLDLSTLRAEAMAPVVAIPSGTGATREEALAPTPLVR